MGIRDAPQGALPRLGDEFEEGGKAARTCNALRAAVMLCLLLTMGRTCNAPRAAVMLCLLLMMDLRGLRLLLVRLRMGRGAARGGTRARGGALWASLSHRLPAAAGTGDTTARGCVGRRASGRAKGT